jgi:AraC family transcriptional regulator
MSRVAQILPLLAFVRDHVDGDVSLEALASRARRSRFDLHRMFRRVVRETPKQYVLRLRLDRAAAELLRGRETILAVALAAGFESHEVFTRAFRRRFGIPPRDYRARGALHGPAALLHHTEVVRGVSPCIGLYFCDAPQRKTAMNTPTVTLRQLTPQPVLVTRRRITAPEIAETLGQILPAIFAHAQAAAVPLVGPPFTRYLSTGRGLMTIEGGMPIGGLARAEGEIEISELPGGLAAVAVHTGPYETLAETHTAVERWIEAHGHVIAGAPWEVYVTDPGEKPDPADWRTEVIYPLRG